MNKILDTGTVPPVFSYSHVNAWQTSEIIAKLELTDQCIDELSKAARKTNDENFLEVATDDLSACFEIAENLKHCIIDGSGVVLLNRFPVEDYEKAVCRRASGIMANMISPLMAQDVKGTLLYDVVDEGHQTSNTTRRSKTNVEQPFHTDGPWFDVPPNVISLFCLQPAEVGGFSQVSSLHQTLMSLFENDSERVDLLMGGGVPWNRMGQFQNGERPYSDLPIMETSTKGTIIRHYADYVRTGHELADETMQEQLDELLIAIDKTLGEVACEPFRLEAGQFQFVNNWTVAHARAKFSDVETSGGRHLLRLWNTPVQMQ